MAFGFGHQRGAPQAPRSPMNQGNNNTRFNNGYPGQGMGNNRYTPRQGNPFNAPPNINPAAGSYNRGYEDSRREQADHRMQQQFPGYGNRSQLADVRSRNGSSSSINSSNNFRPSGVAATMSNSSNNRSREVSNDGDLISFDDVSLPSPRLPAPRGGNSNILSEPPRYSSNRDEDSRSESSTDEMSSNLSSSSYEQSQRAVRSVQRESRQLSTELSATDRSAGSVENLTQAAAQMSLSTVSYRSQRHPEVLVAPKKAPAVRTDKEKVVLITNFFPLEVRSKIVYRYDLNVTLLRPAGKPEINLAKGPRDDAAKTERNAFCMRALRTALEAYRIMRDGEAFVYDGASILFSSDNLDYALKPHDQTLTLKVEQLSQDDRLFLQHYPDITAVAVNVVACKESAASFDISQFHNAQGNRDMAHLDRTWKQFFDMLTNQDCISSGKYTLFGAGKLFSRDGRREDAKGGQERIRGANKGIKFIEAGNGPSKTVAALLLDSKVGQFFKSQQLVRTVGEYMNWPENPNMQFPFKDGRAWKKANDLIRGLRLKRMDGHSASFVATGISRMPISDITEQDVGGRVQPVLDGFPNINRRDIRTHWPAVVVRSRIGMRVIDRFFPMEILSVAPNQRVPKFKLDDNPPRADKPHDRYRNIGRLMCELNLHDGARNNRFLNAFGVSVSPNPLRVEAIRRQRPQIVYGGGQSARLDDAKASWRVPNTRYIQPATADTVVIAYACPKNVAEGAMHAIRAMLKERGVTVINWDGIPLDTGCGDLKMAMDKLFNEVKGKIESKSYGSRVIMIFIDRKETKSHGLLKLYERMYQVLTQHVSFEVAIKLQQQAQTRSNVINKLNCKLTGLNHSIIPDGYTKNAWITDNKSLIIGYDVAHPPPQLRSEILDKKPPTSPSVVGFSFNGGPHSESFIGDYHFQEPRKEEVSDEVLNTRMKWMLTLYCANRKQMPENIFIIRDGVSEGQYRMTVEREMGSIRQGVEEYCNQKNITGYNPKYVCVIVTKRHNARFFTESRQGIDNPLPGTVVDTHVTRNDMTEFYMQSHRVLQGTGKSPSYVVLVDELGLSMDQLQSFLLALCFSHQIFEGSISLPEPVYQADEWAKRGSEVWKTFEEYYNVPLKADHGEYSSAPIDFETMTKQLAYWGTSLQQCRVNA